MKSPEKSAFETILIVAVVLAIVLLPLAAKAESHGEHSPPPFTEFDQDGDGFTVGDGDCDDTNVDINPDAVDVADGIDNDCDGEIDEDADGE